MTEPETIEDFFGVYLLYCNNPKYKGRTYIGYTRDPNRRITQHNRGTWAGGAHRTNNKGPWKMVMIIHGFPNNISALRFEWAWQNPSKTTRLQYLNLRKIPRKETEYQFKIRVLSEMLRVGPWNRLPLVIRWLEADLCLAFPPGKEHPSHMVVKHGPVKAKPLKSNHKDAAPTSTYVECLLCSGYLNSAERLTCLNANCDLATHVTCLADLFLEPGEFVPIGGKCPFCDTELLWGDLIRKLKGCSQGSSHVSPDDEECEEDRCEEDALCSQDGAFVDNNSWFLDRQDL
ncbi:unnamed protein product, partial [Iphiclides podalirius]